MVAHRFHMPDVRVQIPVPLLYIDMEMMIVVSLAARTATGGVSPPFLAGAVMGIAPAKGEGRELKRRCCNV